MACRKADIHRRVSLCWRVFLRLLTGLSMTADTNGTPIFNPVVTRSCVVHPLRLLRSQSWCSKPGLVLVRGWRRFARGRRWGLVEAQLGEMAGICSVGSHSCYLGIRPGLVVA